MTKIYCFFLLFLLASLHGRTQYATIAGTVTDTLNKKNLSQASISLLRATDSVLVKSMRSDGQGHFTLAGVGAGEYILLLTYPSYADYIDKVAVAENETRSLGNIMLTLKSKILEDVLVRSKVAAVRMRGDTTEYVADSFKVREGASVEEMLRQLPGLQVDKDGKIIAQGEEVKKVLVDGEEFFGNDPTMATKNLQASAINKVQVFDKKSDQAVFSGIDDGQKTKTINLTMKDDKKKGYFGKLELAGGPEDRWNNTLMLNSFKAKRKLSVYGIMSSTGKTGLDWGEQEKFGEGLDLEMTEDGGMFISSGGNDEFSQERFQGQGLPKSWSTGINYGNKFNDDKQTVNGSYRYNKLTNEGNANTFSQYILPDTVFYQRNNNEFVSSKQRNSANGTFDVQIDSFTSVKIKANGYTGTDWSNNSNITESISKTNSLVNRSARNISATGSNSSMNSNVMLRKRFRKAGRTVSLSLIETYLTTNTTGYLNSLNTYYDKDELLINSGSIDQMKLYNLSTLTTSGRLVYTEPVVKNIFVELNYGMNLNNSESKKLSYDKDNRGKYENLNDTFSNNFRFRILTNSGGMAWRYNGKKLVASIGSDIAVADFTQDDKLKNSTVRYSYTNLFPRSNLTYKINPNSGINLNYSGRTQQPTIQQIQPVADNNNPLNVFVGNDQLKQSFRQSVRLSFNSYKVLTQQNMYVVANLNTTSNAISTSQVTATSGTGIGRTTYQYINVDGNYNFNLFSGFGYKLQKFDLRLSSGLSFNTNRSNNLVNGRKNTNTNNNYSVRTGISKYKEKKYSIYVNADIGYNTSHSSIRPDVSTKYFNNTIYASANITLPARFEVNTDIMANLRQKTAVFDNNNNVVVWNAYIGKRIFKNDKGLISIRVNDLLDQNRGFNRFIGSNVVTENTYTSLRRYFQLNFTWNFAKTPGNMPAN